jgi:hypothetical protein
MNAFLQKFALVVAGVLQGFDRVVFKGKLRELYRPDGMNILLGVNHVRRGQFKPYVAEITKKVVAASLVAKAKELDRFRYLNSSSTNKEQVARALALQHDVREGLVCVLQCVEPCWTFDTKKMPDGSLTIRGERGKCSHLYHYYLHPRFGWMYVRLQTWFPFELQIGINGREWLARQMDRDNLRYTRSDNKFLWVENWQRAQELLDEQQQTDWVKELNALQRQVHPSHPDLLGGMDVAYNWTVFQSELATDVAFQSAQELQPCFERWLRQAWLTYDSVDVLRFLGRSGVLTKKSTVAVQTSQHAYFEGKRIKHWVNRNSLKMYSHDNVLRVEMTINDPKEIKAFRRSNSLVRPRWSYMWRPLRRSVEDLPHRVVVGEKANDRYLETLAALVDTRTVRELTEPLTRRVPEPANRTDGAKDGAAPRHVRGLNPLKADDAQLLAAVSDPKWMVQGLRNRDLVAALYTEPAQDDQEKRRRSSRMTRLLRILRAHGLLDKIAGTHRYQMAPEARAKIQNLLALRNANANQLTSNAA